MARLRTILTTHGPAASTTLVLDDLTDDQVEYTQYMEIPDQVEMLVFPFAVDLPGEEPVPATATQDETRAWKALALRLLQDQCRYSGADTIVVPMNGPEPNHVMSTSGNFASLHLRERRP